MLPNPEQSVVMLLSWYFRANYSYFALSVNFKDGVPPDDVLEKLGKKIGSDWRPLGRRLGFEDEELDELEEAHKHLSQKSYQMLKKGKRRKCDEATSLYIILYEALSHEFVGRRDLAGEYCTEKKNSFL